MYKFVVVSLIVLVIFQGALARPKAKQAAPPKDEKSNIDEIAGKARELIQNASQAIEGNLPDSKEIAQKLTETTQNFASKIKSVVDDLAKQSQEHKGDVENVLNQVKERLTATATQLQNSIGPEATKKVKEIKASLDEGFNKAITEAQKLGKAAEPQIGQLQRELNTAAKSILEQVVNDIKDIQNQIDKNTKSKN